MSTSATIRRVSYSEILSAPNAQEIFDEYAAECSIPDAEPQWQTYAAMEGCGALQCFAAYVNDEMVGFASLLMMAMPHHGKRIATIESIFVQARHRESGAGNALLAEVETYAENCSCEGINGLARIGSRMEIVMLRRSKWSATHTQFTRWFA